MTRTKPTIAVLGAGAWGTALAVLLSRNGLGVRVWGHDPAHVERLRRKRLNPALPGIRLPESIEFSADLSVVAGGVRAFLVAVPSHAFRVSLEGLKVSLAPDGIVAWASKGFEPGSGKLLATVMDEVLGRRPRAIVSGPTFAIEVARGLPAALTVASEDPVVARTVCEWLRNDRLRVYTSEDVTGVQLGGAIKNVIAIAAGISDGLGFGANARAALITRGLAELARLGVAMGGRKETFWGLAGAGDLILTCTDDTSRNRRVGLGLGRGKKLADVLTEIGQEAEGVATARELYRLAHKLNVDMPITEQVYRVLYEDVPSVTAVETLFKREPRAE
ncbi:glycerol-3-phosphate dehydrogenase [Sulfurifustis variabilis]|uniref:Glycerol-3-phosphate dehydrogenase [NAD(P)+] n=1 Tax=Sulfurifustis variabilis TaxID=1675686 RepID=A0A1B4V0Y3_9GAMM|nr:NAD(P)H-dependent glycerol-3-phosphate dehydrogenase [Sulfurifustis variabilis]BAU47003.1 glycerol-3-phosphate dehydrogenase [Sulfurifustis variabilis]